MYNHQLETFVRVADAGSFSRVADDLYISPTAVIKQINQLESRLGIKLFCRTHRGVCLTEAGKSLYRDAKYIIRYAAESLARAKAEPPERVIRMGTSLMTPSRFIMELWPQIHASFPQTTLQLVSFENTPENAREILHNLGQNIDVVAGVFDEEFLHRRGCAAFELSKEAICCALPLRHRLATKAALSVQDLYGENLMLIRRGWNRYVDLLRDRIEQQHPQINITDFPFYDISVFNRCESQGNLLMVIDKWDSIHPLLKIIPVEWDYVIPFGILYSPIPSEEVSSFIQAVNAVFKTVGLRPTPR